MRVSAARMQNDRVRRGDPPRFPCRVAGEEVAHPRYVVVRTNASCKRLGMPLAMVAAVLSWGVRSPARAEGRQTGLPLKLEEPKVGQRPRHVGRAVLETVGILAAGLVWYWRDLNFNTRDWDLTWDGESWKRKLVTFDALRFDQNLFQTNAVSHSRAGLAHYQILRANGFGAPASIAGTFATSVVWEYLVEFKELISANDIIVNSVAGFALGEPFYQLGEFFLRSSPSLFSRGMAGALSPVATMNDWVDGRRRTRDAGDPFGFTREAWHRFHLTGAMASRTFDRTIRRDEVGLGLGAELVMLPGYGRPGHLRTWTEPGAFTAISAELDLASRRNAGGVLRTRTTLAGHYGQEYDRRWDGRVAGRGRLLGIGSGFEYEEVERPDGQDYLAVMNIVGPVWEIAARSNDVQVRWLGELYGDFAMVKSLAMEGRMPVMAGSVYHPADSGGIIPGVLGARGYYFALGLTASSRLLLEYWGWDAGIEWRGDRFRSIAGLDRFREEMRSELQVTDRRATMRTWLGLRPWGAWPLIQAGLDWRWREGLAGELRNEHFDQRLTAALSFVF
jgi:hypothetical protein